MPDGISVTFMVYGNVNRAQSNKLIADACDWLASNSQFNPVPQVRRVSRVPMHPNSQNVVFLGPDDLNWSDIPPAQFVVLLWNNMPYGPSYYGGTWGVGPPVYGHWRGDPDDVCAVISVPVACSQNGWAPGGGGEQDGVVYPNYPSNYCSTLCHEWCHGIHSWLADQYKYNVTGLYSLSPPELIHMEGHNRFLTQITEPMYADMLRHIELPAAAASPLPLLVGLGVVGSIAVRGISREVQHGSRSNIPVGVRVRV